MTEARPILIYGVADPRSGELRYVGKTKRSLAFRLADHMRYRGNTHRSTWFRSLAKAGVAPDIFVIEATTPELWRDDEMFWIAYFRSIGCRLVNLSVGGDGANGVSDTPEVRLKKSLGMRGKAKSLEHRRKLSEALKGKPSPNLGRTFSEEVRKKVGDAQRGKPKGSPSAQHRENLSKAARRRSPESYKWSPLRRASYEKRFGQ